MNDLLSLTLSLAVPLRIQQLQAAGGPSEYHRELAQRTYADEIGAHGDTMLFGGKPGEAARLCELLIDALAVLAFCDGGVTAFGQSFVAEA